MDISQSTPTLQPSPPDSLHPTSITTKPLASAVAAGSSAAGSALIVKSDLRLNKVGARDGSLAYTLQDATTFIFQLVALIVALVFGAWAIKSYNAAMEANDLSSRSYQAALKGNDLSDRSLQMALSSNHAADYQASLQSQQTSLQNQVVLAQGQLAMLQYCHNQGAIYDTAVCGAILAALPVASIASVLSIGVSFPSTIAATTPGPPTTMSTQFVSGTGFSSVSPPIGTSSPDPVASSSAGASLPPLSLGPIIGIIAGLVAFLGALLALVMLRLRKRSRALYDE